MLTTFSRQRDPGNLILQNSYYYKIAKYAFWIMIFFTLWGTEVPSFKSGAETETTSSPAKQLLYSGLFLSSLVCLIPRKNEFLKIIKDEKFLALFLLYSLVSMYWSDFSFLTFKRIFQVIAIYMSIVCFLIYVDSAEEILKPLKYNLYLYLILTFMVVLALPEARQGALSWKGFTSNKNTLGQMGFISVILCYIIYKGEKASLRKTFAAFMVFISVVITIGSRSSTSFIIIFFIAGLAAITSLDSFFVNIRIGKTISFITLTTFFILVLSIMIWSPELGATIPELFGKDTSFSGRTELWDYLMNLRKINPILGSGYGAFWVPESERIIGIHDIFIWLPGQAHNGYIDILLSTGYIGFGLIILILINYLLNYINIRKPHPWILFILATIIINFQESTIMRSGHPVNFIFIFAYLMLFVNKFKDFNWTSMGAEQQELLQRPVNSKYQASKWHD